MPDQYLIIADSNYGDTICIDLMTNNIYDAPIIQWDKDMKDISRSWCGLVEWRMDKLEEGSLLVDYDGEEKNVGF